MPYVPKNKSVYIDVDKFKRGLYALEDTTKAPIGSFRLMQNVQITDRGGVAPRFGTELLGAYNSSTHPVNGLYEYRRSFGTNKILMKAYDDELEIYSSGNTTQGWTRLKSGFTQDSDFGFVTSLVNTDNNDYVIYNNRYEPYQKWSGAITTLTGTLTGGEVAIPVTSVLTEETYESKTASANSATTVTVSTAAWATSQWVNFYIYFPSTGKIRKITANTGTLITFDTLGAGPGNIAFEIRQLAFSPTGNIIYNGTVIAYTGIDIATAFTVVSAHASASGVLVTQTPIEYADGPRGNRLTNYLNRIVVGNVRSALAKNSGGALQGYSSAGSYFVSKINTPTDFGYSIPRVAGEGDIVSTPYGGGEITDVSIQEDTAYIFKRSYIESVKYSQDVNDVAARVPLKATVGSVGRIIKGNDDIYFVTDNNELTSIGRIKTLDVLPQTDNIGFSIKRLLDTYDFTDVHGIEYKSKIYIGCRSSSNVSHNDIVLIYSKTNKSFEGIWDIASSGITTFDNNIVYSQSNGANVLKLFTGTADVFGTDRYPIYSNCETHFMNLSGSKVNQQALNSIYFEGYIAPGSTITFKSFKDFETTPFLQFNFSGNESGLIDGSLQGSYLGSQPIGLQPLGSFSDLDNDGRYHFQFRVYVPFQYGNYFSVGWESNGTDLDYEVTRFGLGLKESVSVDTNTIKNIN